MRDAHFTIYRVTSGVPFRCFDYERWTEVLVDPAHITAPKFVLADHPGSSLLDRGIHINRPGAFGLPTVIPTHPIWTGLTLNTLIYAGLVLVTRTLFIEARAARRRRRGVCARCAYPLPHGSPTCPECGAQDA